MQIDFEKAKAASVKDIAARLGMQRRSNGRYTCPDCQAKAVAVYPDHAYCFQCQRYYSGIDLVMQDQGLTAIQAAAWINGADFTPRPADPGIIQIDQNETSDILTDFVNRCIPITADTTAPAYEYMTGRGLSGEVLERLNIRYCTQKQYYIETLKMILESDHNIRRLQAAGLATGQVDNPRPIYVEWNNAGLDFIVMPYYKGGRIVYLKARAVADKADLEKRNIKRFINLSIPLPCMYNVDGIADADAVYICEGEIDTLTALTDGKAAAGIPGCGSFKQEWTEPLKGKQCILALDADRAGQAGTSRLIKTFERAGLPAPKIIRLPPGHDLNSYYMELSGIK